jgi:excinuclease ABC subunit B
MADDSDKQTGGPAAPEHQRKRAKPAKKDPARPTRAKANRPDFTPTAPELEALLNPGIGKGTAGLGSGTGLKPPPDNSRDRRADFAAAHTARKSTTPGFDESPQSGYGVEPLLLGQVLRKLPLHAQGGDVAAQASLVGCFQSALAASSS